jgi:ABC-type antimicrobial peptide transport system permease subunit
MKICGFVSTGTDISKFNSLFDGSKASTQEEINKKSLLDSEFTELLKTSYINLGYVSDSFISNYRDSLSYYVPRGFDARYSFTNGTYANSCGLTGIDYRTFDSQLKDSTAFFSTEEDSLSSNELVLNYLNYLNLTSGLDSSSSSNSYVITEAVNSIAECDGEITTASELPKMLYQASLIQYVFDNDCKHADDAYNNNYNNFQKYCTETLYDYLSKGVSDRQKAFYTYLNNNLDGESLPIFVGYQDMLTTYKKLCDKYVNQFSDVFFSHKDLVVYYPNDINDISTTYSSLSLKIVGLKMASLEDNMASIDSENAYFYLSNPDMGLFFGDKINQIYSEAISPMPSDKKAIRKLAKMTFEKHQDGDYYFKLDNYSVTMISQLSSTFESLAKVFLYIGLGLALFASLTLYNFISVSINNKKHEIGILRAVGARGKDVFNIFFLESLIIALINFVFATIGVFICCYLISSNLIKGFNLPFTLLSPSIRQVLLILGVSVLVSFISSLLPVLKIASKKPIDAIQNR